MTSIKEQILVLPNESVVIYDGGRDGRIVIHRTGRNGWLLTRRPDVSGWDGATHRYFKTQEIEDAIDDLLSQGAVFKLVDEPR